MPDLPTAKPKVTSHGIELPVNPAWEVHPAEVKDALDKKDQMALLDVRRPDEWNKVRLPGATLIPLQELGARLSEIAPLQTQRVVVYCHHGSRSLHAAAFLRRQGFTNVHSMAGGIEAYALTADPDIPRY